jgi:hypothetical protein
MADLVALGSVRPALMRVVPVAAVPVVRVVAVVAVVAVVPVVVAAPETDASRTTWDEPVWLHTSRRKI